MNDALATKQAKEEILEKWHEVMRDQMQQMIDMAREREMDPAWFYPKKIIEKAGVMRIHWGLRPDIEAAFTALMTGGSAEEAAKIGAEFSQKSLDQLIMDDTVWESED